MAHDHHHDSGTYYLEQLCTIGICAGIAGVTVMMYSQDKLKYILATKFHLPVLVGGIALLVLAVFRAVALWISVDDSIPVHDHNHNHEHPHDHDDAHHHHDHVHVAGEPYDHDHGPLHDHDHGPAEHVPARSGDHGHDHGWNPWRYAVLLLPVVLYFLNFPNEGFSNVKSGLNPEDIDITASATGAGDLIPVEFKELGEAAYDPVKREFFEAKRVQLTGQFAPSGNDKVFTLVRYKITCCAPDAVQVNVMIVSPDPIRVKRGKWVDVTGQIHFARRKDRDEFIPVLQTSRKEVKEVPPPPNPYIQ